MPDPFVSTQDLSDYLGRDVVSDNGAIMALDAACDICRDIAEQDFNAGTTTITLDGGGTDTILLRQRPVTMVAGTVVVNGQDETCFQWTAAGRLIRGTSDPRWIWPLGKQNVTVTYEHGFADGEVPRSIRMVALGIASRYVVQGVAESETVGDVTVDYGMSASDLTDNELRILQKYRAITTGDG